MTCRWWLAAATAYAGCTVLLTWPVLREPGKTVLDCASLYGAAEFKIQRDINLTLWILAWGAHALGTDPTRVLHGNAFHPAPWSLALSEHMLGNQPLFAPMYLATQNPILSYHWTMLSTFVLAGLTMAAWVLHHTRDGAAAFAAGVLYAFAPFRLWQLGSLHVISTQWIPLVPLGIDLALDGRGPLGATLLALGLVLSTGCSYYTGYAAFALGASYGVCAWATRREARRHTPWLIAGTGVAAAIVTVVSVPYVLLQHQGLIPRHGGARWADMSFVALALDGPLGVVGRYVHFRRPGIPIFLGWVTLVLAATGAGIWRRPPRGALLAAAAVILVLSMGPTASVLGRTVPLPYRLVAMVVPGFSAMRQPQRFALAMSFVAAALSGLALASLRSLLVSRGRRRTAAALPAAASLLALALVWTPGLRVRPMPVGEAMPPAHRWLAAHGDAGALLELPISPDTRTRLFQESTAMYTSTAHWLPLVNGYTVHPPPVYELVSRQTQRLPGDPAVLARIHRVVPSLRWVLLHRDRVPPAAREQWDAALTAAGLTRAAEFDDAVVWRMPEPQRSGARRPGAPVLANAVGQRSPFTRRPWLGEIDP